MSFSRLTRSFLRRALGRSAPALPVALSSSELSLTHLPAPTEEPEFHKISTSGRIVPIYPSYRYGLKRGWLYYSSLSALNDLMQRELLPKEGVEFLALTSGTRTLTMPLGEVDQMAKAWIEPYADLFIGGILPPSSGAMLDPGDPTLVAAKSAMAVGYRQIMEKVKRTTDISMSDLCGHDLLEIGFNDGLSCLAWEELGFRVTAIDNGYGIGAHDPAAPFIQKRLGGRAAFQFGDVVKGLAFSNGAFSVIVSTSVLEHILDLPAALKEMHRLLADDGIMIHSYHPYFGPDGGHAQTIPDFPWGHVRLSLNDYSAYLDDFRPHEAEVAKQFLSEGLHRSYPIASMQTVLAASGFELLLWREDAASQEKLIGLCPQVCYEAQQAYPGVSLRDLIARNIFFIARKSKID
ncbi:MAG: class I SAM-dependent methyltransferase [Alphaproteobacteria bacterium]|nr:class I SAM-dependent methyltransferase [Alphaproteobacteria bacterium]